MDNSLAIILFAAIALAMLAHFSSSERVIVREKEVNYVTVVKQQETPVVKQQETPVAINDNSRVNEQAVKREDVINLTGQSLDISDDVEKRSESNSKAGGVGTKLF